VSADPIRVQKAIGDAGLMSRRAAEDLIREGRVSVNGRTVILGDRVDPSRDVVEIDGSRIPVAPGMVAILLNKPTGVISTASDPHGRPTVVDLVASDRRVWPVGRLDADSGGLIILTNDGELTNRLTHPSFGATKTYTALVAGDIGPRVLRRMREGVELDDGPARAVTARIVDRSSGRTLVEVVMTEGRNREVRRMFDAVGHPVAELTRTAIGPLRDPRLKPGAWRPLTPSEVATLYRASAGNG
jgi:23S rRNA pseudouridine2605 synthase